MYVYLRVYVRANIHIYIYIYIHRRHTPVDVIRHHDADICTAVVIAHTCRHRANYLSVHCVVLFIITSYRYHK